MVLTGEVAFDKTEGASAEADPVRSAIVESVEEVDIKLDGSPSEKATFEGSGTPEGGNIVVVTSTVGDVKFAVTGISPEGVPEDGDD